MAFGLYCLAVNPDVQDKVRDEVDTVLKKHGGQISFDAIQEMTYLDMVLSGKPLFASLRYAFVLKKSRNFTDMDSKVHFA
jgi:hypothetical protein